MKSRALYLLPLVWLIFCYALYTSYIHQQTRRLAAGEERMLTLLEICRNLHDRIAAWEDGPARWETDAARPPWMPGGSGDLSETMPRPRVFSDFSDFPNLWNWREGGVPEQIRNMRLWAAYFFTTLGVFVGALICYGLHLHRRTLSALAYREQRARIMTNLVDAVLFEYSPDRKHASYSPFWHRVFGCPPPDAAATPEEAIRAHAVEEDRQSVRDMFARLRQGAEKAETEARLLRGDGGPLWCRIQACNLTDDLGRPCMAGSIINIDSEKKERLALQHKALYDALTGILNRSGFQAAVEVACGVHCAGHGRCPGKTGTPARPDLCPRTAPVPPCVFGLVDMDHFKELNDTHGHPAGDAVLQRLGTILRESFPPPSSVGRLGGDEFAFFLPRYPGMTELERLLKGFQRRLAAAGIDGAPIECSIGVIVETPGECRYTAYFELADRALYEAKNKGRNRYIVYNRVAVLPSPAAIAVRDPSLES